MNSARDTARAVGCPIRRSRDQRSLASPPGFSQRATSFIASQCQGIHQMPFSCFSRHTQRQTSPAKRKRFAAGVRQNHLVSPKAIDAPGLTRGPSGPALGAARATPVAVGGTVVPPWQSSPFRRHFVTEPAGPENPIMGPRPPLPSRSQLASSQLSISNTPAGLAAGGGNSYHLPRSLGCFQTGGGERARTVDLRLAKPALSQLS